MADPNIVEQIMEVLNDPMNLPDAFWGYMIQRWIADAPVLPISQVFGFTQFTAKSAAFVRADESTSSLTYTDLATVGPQLTGLANGQYVILYGATADSGSLTDGEADFSISVNGATPADNDAVVSSHSAYPTSLAIAVVKTLSAGSSNSLSVKYKSVTGTTCGFGRRWLLALKIANA